MLKNNFEKLKTHVIETNSRGNRNLNRPIYKK